MNINDSDVKSVKRYFGPIELTKVEGKFYAGIVWNSPLETHWMEIPEPLYIEISDEIDKTRKEAIERETASLWCRH